MIVLALAINFQGFTVETLYREQSALKNKIDGCGGKLFLYGPGYDYPTNDVSSYVDALNNSGNSPDVIISYLSERHFSQPLPEEICSKYSLNNEYKEFPRGLERVSGIPKVMWINDFWHMTPEQWDWALLGHGFGHAIATYCPPFLRESDFRAAYSSRLREHVRFHPLSRGITPEIFKDYGEARDLDVTLLGARGEFYPLRDYFHQSLESQTWFSYFSRPHPGYQFDQPAALSGPSYAKVLSRSKIFVSCTGRYSLPFIKIFEVLAAGALLMCDRPCGASHLGLVDAETYVEVDRVNFLEKVRHYLGNEQERAKIAGAGCELFQRRHTTKANADKMYDLLADIVEDHRTCELNAGGGAARDCGGLQPARPPSAGPAAGRAPSGIAGFLLGRLGSWRRAFAPASLPVGVAGSPWEEIKAGTRLDWSRVVEVRHALEVCQLNTVRELSLVERFGLNAYWSQAPVLTHYPETIAVRPKILKLLAAALQARVLCEIGTARGLQAVFWADYLQAQRAEGSIVATCDLVGHDDPVYRMPLSGELLWTRRELWEQESAGKLIDFVHGDSAALGAMLDRKLGEGRGIDLLFVDGRHDEAGAHGDYSNLKRRLDSDSVLVFDDCDPRFPGVEQAVNRVAAEMDTQVRLITFWPAPYTLAVLNSKVSLSSLTSKSSPEIGC